MKHLLTQLGLSVGLASYATVGSPSADRRRQQLKHITFMLLFLLAGVGQVLGEDVTFTPGQFTSWTTTAGEQSQTISGFTITSSSGMRDSGNGHLRWYANNTHTITSTVGNITKVVITCTANGTNSNGPGKLSGTGYTASTGKTGTWEGNSATVTFTGGQSRVTKIEITYTPSGSTETTD